MLSNDRIVPGVRIDILHQTGRPDCDLKPKVLVAYAVALDRRHFQEYRHGSKHRCDHPQRLFEVSFVNRCRQARSFREDRPRGADDGLLMLTPGFSPFRITSLTFDHHGEDEAAMTCNCNTNTKECRVLTTAKADAMSDGTDGSITWFSMRDGMSQLHPTNRPTHLPTYAPAAMQPESRLV